MDSEQAEVVGEERPVSQDHRRAEVLGPAGRREAGEDAVAPIELPEHLREVTVMTQPVQEKIERVPLTTSKPCGLDEPFVAVEHRRFIRQSVGALVESGAEGLGHHVEDPFGRAAEQGAEALAQKGVRGPGDGRIGAVLENQPSAPKTPEQPDQTGLCVQEESGHLAASIDQHTEQIERYAAGEHGQAGEQLPLLDWQAVCVVREHARELRRFRIVAPHRIEVEALDLFDAPVRERVKVRANHRHRKGMVTDLKSRAPQGRFLADVGLGNRLALGFQLQSTPRIHGGRRQGSVQRATSRSTSARFSSAFRELSAPYRSSPTLLQPLVLTPNAVGCREPPGRRRTLILSA